jgi:hypothetical protein
MKREKSLLQKVQDCFRENFATLDTMQFVVSTNHNASVMRNVLRLEEGSRRTALLPWKSHKP